MYNHDPTYLFQTGGYWVNESDTATVHNLHESNVWYYDPIVY